MFWQGLIFWYDNYGLWPWQAKPRPKRTRFQFQLPRHDPMKYLRGYTLRFPLNKYEACLCTACNYPSYSTECSKICNTRISYNNHTIVISYKQKRTWPLKKQSDQDLQSLLQLLLICFQKNYLKKKQKKKQKH